MSLETSSGKAASNAAPFEVIRRIDGTSASLFSDAIRGAPLRTVKIVLSGLKGATAMTIELEDVRVVGYSLTPNDCQDEVIEHDQFSYGRIRITAAGHVACYDVAQKHGC